MRPIVSVVVLGWTLAGCGQQPSSSRPVRPPISTKGSELHPVPSTNVTEGSDLERSNAIVALRAIGAEVHFRGPHGVYVSVWPKDRGYSVSFGDTDLVHARALTELEKLSLGYSQVSDQGLAYLSTSSNLRELVLLRAPITDAGLVHLRQLPSLEVLSLSGTKVSDDGLKHLACLPLTFLNLSGTKVSDDGLKQLTCLPLTYLNLSGTAVTDAGLADVQRFTKLEVLLLGGTEITSEGLSQLRELTRLKELGIGGVEITNDGVGHLKALPELRSLNYDDYRASDATLTSLSQLTELKWLSLINSDNPDEDIERLRRALPETRINYGYAHD